MPLLHGSLFCLDFVHGEENVHTFDVCCEGVIKFVDMTNSCSNFDPQSSLPMLFRYFGINILRLVAHCVLYLYKDDHEDKKVFGKFRILFPTSASRGLRSWSVRSHHKNKWGESIFQTLLWSREGLTCAWKSHRQKGI